MACPAVGLQSGRVIKGHSWPKSQFNREEKLAGHIPIMRAGSSTDFRDIGLILSSSLPVLTIVTQAIFQSFYSKSAKVERKKFFVLMPLLLKQAVR